MTDRLTKSDWVTHGLRTLASDGANALKIGPMAATLNVSRGSFYWHFRDIADFRTQLLQSWQDHTVDQVIAETEAQLDRLKHLLTRALTAKRNLEGAIRSWAAEDENVAAIVAVVDARRIAYIEKLLVAAGVETKSASPRAAFLYWACLGQPLVMDPGHSSISEIAINDLGDLFEK